MTTDDPSTPAVSPAPWPGAETPRALTLQERAEVTGFRLAQGVIWPLSPLQRSGLAGALGRGLGGRLWLAKRIDANLQEVRPQFDAADRRRIAKGVMDNFARTAVEYTVLPDLFRRATSMTVEGVEHLRAAKEANGGRLVVVSAHLGNWEAVRAVAAAEGAPLAIIYRAFNNRAIDETCYGFITSTGMPAFHKGADGARALFKHVRAGGGAMILVDQRLGGAPLLDFMGHPAETSLAAAQLAATLKAPLLPAVGFRDGDSFRVRFEPSISKAPLKDMMGAVNGVIGGWVDASPEQWFWLHRRWRVRREADRHRKHTVANEAPAAPAPDATR